MSSKVKVLVIGSDPECFLRHKETKELVSAIGLVPGTKSEPHPVPELGEGFALQTDNVAVEWNVPPTDSYTQMYRNNKAMIDYINSIIPGDLELHVVSSGFFDPAYLTDPRAIEAGCEADYNAWELCMNEAADYSITNCRAVAGHIHVSYENPNDDHTLAFIKALDLFLGVPSVILDPDKDRRKYYGKAGCFRISGYGFEYRSLGNFWINDMELTKWVFDGIKKAEELVNSGKEFTDEESLKIQAAINTNSVDLALDLMRTYQMESILPVVID